jgi:nucleoside triphosphate diphosphatase
MPRTPETPPTPQVGAPPSASAATTPLRPDALADAGPYPAPAGGLDRALAMVRYLRTHCPWDRKQTAESLIPYLLEETHETIDAIRAGDVDALEGELGDLLLNVAFQIVVAEEGGETGAEQVVERLEQKMVRRHPHLFGLGAGAPWEVLKARERAEREEREERGERDGVLSGLPLGLDPLLRAYRLQQKAAGVGFDWADAEGALAKVREELSEVEGALQDVRREERRVQDADTGNPGAGDAGAGDAGAGNPRAGDATGAARSALADEIGDLLFSVVNVARLAGVNPLPALDHAGRKFQRRFEGVEARARAEGIPIPGATLETLDALWDAVKADEA